MMKKLVVFILVAWCTSVANATLDLFYGVDTITFSGNIDSYLYVAAGIYDGTLSPMSDAALGSAAPSMSGYSGPISDLEGTINFPSYLQGGYWIMASAPGEAYQTGDYLNLTVSDMGQYVQFYSVWFDESGGYGRIGPDPLFPEVFLGLLWDFETNILTVSGFTETDISVVLVGSDVTLSPLSDDALGPAASGTSAYGGPSSELEGLGYFPEEMDGGYWNLGVGGMGNHLMLNASDVGPTSRVFAAIYGADFWGGNYRVIGDITIPELMTIALLGLGGLFILKHRRKNE